MCRGGRGVFKKCFLIFFVFVFLNVFTWKYFVTIFKDHFSNMGVNSMGYSIKFGRGGVGGGGGGPVNKHLCVKSVINLAKENSEPLNEKQFTKIIYF